MRGFTPVVAVVIIAVVLAGGVFGFNAFKKYNSMLGGSHPGFSDESMVSGKGLLGQPCEGSGTKKLNTFPLNPKDIELIVPMGRVQDSHVTPTDHQYIIPKGTIGRSIITDNPKQYEIKAPADGYIINIELFKEPVEKNYRKDPYQENYLVIFEHSCDHYTRLIHIDSLSDKVNSQVKYNNPDSQHPNAHPRIKVKEGEVIGTVGPHSFDFQIMDMGNPDKNIISPQNIDPWTYVTVDTFDYVSDSLKSELLSKNLKKKEPLGGKIGYDRKGTLLGNWFKVGRDQSQRDEYWTQNLSIVYDHIDDSQIRISLGDFGGYSKAYGVSGNTPDPKDVTASSGVVKYKLVKFDYHESDGKVWDTMHFVEGLVAKNTGELTGVVLFELQQDGKLKMETFPGKSGSEISGFTSKALMYER